MSLRKKNIVHYLFAGTMLVFALLLRYLGRPTVLDDSMPYGFLLGLLRSFIYIFLLFYWQYWLEQRLLHPQTKRGLLGISRLLIFWFFLRSVKFHIFGEFHPVLSRYAWYGYYFPLLFIPALTLIVSLTLGKTEEYRIQKHWGIVFIEALTLFILVLTNDLHQKVFRFSTYPFSEKYYGYGPGYYLILFWTLGTSILSLIIMIRHCRIPQRKRVQILPIIPLILLVIYIFLYYKRVNWIVDILDSGYPGRYDSSNLHMYRFQL